MRSSVSNSCWVAWFSVLVWLHYNSFDCCFLFLLLDLRFSSLWGYFLSHNFFFLKHDKFGIYDPQKRFLDKPWSLYEVIEGILPFDLNTKPPLSDIWLLRYKQNNFGCFWKKLKVRFFLKHPKLFCLYLGNQISLRGRFVFKTNSRISSITSYKNHCCCFFTSWVIMATKMLYFEK